MRPLTFAIPKPLLPVGDRTILEVCIAWLRNSGITDIALSLGWCGNVIESFVGDGKKFGVRIHTVQESMKLGTAGALNTLLREWIGNDDVFITNGDILTRLDLQGMYTFHTTHDAGITVAGRTHITQSRFGVIHKAPTGIIMEEKPSYKELVSAGMYIASPKAIDLIPVYEEFDIPQWINRCQTDKTYGKVVPEVYTFTDPWVALEKPEELEAVSQDQAWLDWIESNVSISGALV